MLLLLIRPCYEDRARWRVGVKLLLQSMYDNIPIPDKELFWIEGSTRRWDGYLQFAKDPSRMLAWFDRHLAD